MNKTYKLGVIGGGFMSHAIVKGVIDSKSLRAEQIMVSDISEVSLEKMRALGVNVTLSNELVASESEYLLFAVKPQSLKDVLSSISCVKVDKIISIMAGIKKQTLKDKFQSALVARCMPNTPCSLSSGAMGLDVTEFGGEDQRFIIDIFSSLGEVVLVGEEKLNAVTGVSGSSPAYFYLFVKGIIEAGVKQGLTEDEAKKLAVNTMLGSSKMILNNGDKTIDELINAVCSKGGTTLQAVKVYNESGLTEITEKAVDACVKRAKELENQ